MLDQGLPSTFYFRSIKLVYCRASSDILLLCPGIASLIQLLQVYFKDILSQVYFMERSKKLLVSSSVPDLLKPLNEGADVPDRLQIEREPSAIASQERYGALATCPAL